MAIQPTPPIQLDPSMDNGHQLAFINQNFQSIANVIQQNSFVILKSGLVAFNWSGGTNTTLTIPHNLGLVPIPFTFLSDAAGSTYTPLPTWTGLSVGTGASSYIQFVDWITPSVDSTNIYIRIDYVSGSSGSGLFIKYYLLQQTAN